MKVTTQNSTTAPVLIGTVSQFNPQRGFGIVLIESHTRSYGLSSQTGPLMVKAGNTVPFFNGRSSKMPLPSDQIAVMLNAQAKVVGWGHAKDWRDAEKLIAGRRQTLPARSARFMERLQKTVQMQLARHAPAADQSKPRTPRPLRTVIFSTTCRA